MHFDCVNVESVSGKTVCSEASFKSEAASQFSSEKGITSNSSGRAKHESLLRDKTDDDIPSPETPGMRPLVPRLKRRQDDGATFGSNLGCSLIDSSKKMKILKDSSTRNGEQSDAASQFEWLDPSRIRDANRRRPGNPLYNQRTLYIPPDALEKMSASQKQYWTVKCQYMDVLLFFKVVS